VASPAVAPRDTLQHSFATRNNSAGNLLLNKIRQHANSPGYSDHTINVFKRNGRKMDKLRSSAEAGAAAQSGENSTFSDKRQALLAADAPWDSAQDQPGAGTSQAGAKSKRVIYDHAPLVGGANKPLKVTAQVNYEVPPVHDVVSHGDNSVARPYMQPEWPHPCRGSPGSNVSGPQQTGHAVTGIAGGTQRGCCNAISFERKVRFSLVKSKTQEINGATEGAPDDAKYLQLLGGDRPSGGFIVFACLKCVFTSFSGYFW